MTPSLDLVRGCLLGGAVGDALGAPVEFLSLAEIRQRYGRAGIAELDEAYGVLGAITDDTQMTLFTAEGLLRAVVRERERGAAHPAGLVHHAYLRWLHTQGEHSAHPLHDPERFDGWLVRERRLHAVRAPGFTCLRALRKATPGDPARPTNDSKGCGGVMRVAPVGVLYEPDEAFRQGIEAAALTHGHPSGYLAAGAFALAISLLVRGALLDEALGAAEGALQRTEGGAETYRALRAARGLAASRPASPEALTELGEGAVAEEALAIAAYAALAGEGGPGTHEADGQRLAAEERFARGVGLAVNHGGDSDSTGAIAGNLLGARFGEGAIPRRWREGVELADVVGAVADDLWAGAAGQEVSAERYPGW